VQPSLTEWYERSPIDVLRLVVFGVIALGLVTISALSERSVEGFERELLALLDFLPRAVERIIVGATQLLAVVVTLSVLAVPAFARRLRMYGYLAAAAVLAAMLIWLAHRGLDRHRTDEAINAIARRGGIEGRRFPSTSWIGSLTAACVSLSPVVTRRWRRAAAISIAVLVVLRLSLSLHLPVDLFAAVALGIVAGTATLLAFGRPDVRPGVDAIASALRRGGLAVTELHPASVDARGSVPYFGQLVDGQRVFAKALGEDQRSADLLFRAYRFVRLKNVGDERPFSSLRRTVEHEALVALQARDVGVRTPRLRAIATTEPDTVILAYDLIDGRSFDSVDVAQIDDDLLRAIWQQVAVLRRHRIAHRDLRRANFFLDDQGQPWIIDFGFSEVAATDAMLDGDVAQLLAALALMVGPERAAETGIDVLGAPAVASALPLLQPNALSGATRNALKAHKGLLDSLQHEVAQRAGVEAPHYEELVRVSGKTVLTAVMIIAIAHFLLPQFTDLSEVIDHVKGADWIWAVPLLVASGVTYLGAMLAMMGAVPVRIPTLPTFLAMFAASFTNKLAPAAVGGMALNVRYLQKSGVDSSVAVTSVGMNSLGGFVTHIILLGVFLVWAGRSAFDSIKLPDPEVLLVGVAVVAVLAVVSFLVPWMRRLLITKFVPILHKALTGIGTVVRTPSKLALLIGGSMLVTLNYLTCLYFAVRAFHGDLSYAQVGAVYLTGAAVASAAPTPGGLGAIEAALIAGLVAAGVDNTVALPAVFLYRLGTFWIPILPGWLSFTWMRRHNYI
jgi:uncharacterized protein (TIRG00374 family)